ncbi:ciliogenesis and planar polarity effector 1-like isoform X4 [Mustelus asterias]
MRQRFSLAAHPRLPYLIVSDGYMFTVLRFAENYSARSVLKTLLLKVTQDLDDVQHLLMKSENKDVKLQPMSSLKRSVLQGWDTQGSGSWMSPSFLQDETPANDQADEDEDSADATPCLTRYPRFPNSDPGTMDQGHLEFASMFDTLHAKQEEPANHHEAKLRQIQNSLLTAWSMVVSVKGMEGKDLLLQYTVRAFLQFARLLPFAPATLPSSVIKLKNKLVKKALRRSPGIYRTLQLLRYCLTVLNWDGVYKHSLPHAVKLSADIVKLILSQKFGPASFSHSLLISLLALKLASVHLDTVYSLQTQGFLHFPWDTASDSIRVPVAPKKKCSLLTFLQLPSQTVQRTQKPSHRLAVSWRQLYQHALQYHSHLRKLQQPSNSNKLKKRLEGEETILTSLLSQVQTTLQTMGERLGPNQQLKPLAGEESFLLGSYLESVQIWLAALQQETGKDRGRVIYLQTRYSLAILYTHLYLYNLCAALDFCEHLVGQVLNQERSEIAKGSDGLGLDSVMLQDVGVDAALAVVQSLARFMALYYTNQPVFVLPPHHTDTMPPLHCEPACRGRVVYLQQRCVSAAVREQQLSDVWSVKYAVTLMLTGRLIPEAVWLAWSLGDWKTAVVLGLAFNLYVQNLPKSVRGHWHSLHLPEHLQPARFLKDKLLALVGCPANAVISSEGPTMKNILTQGSDRKQLPDSVEEDGEVLFGSVQEILKAAVMVDADVLTETFELLMQTAKDFGSSLPGLVPDGLYLPAPPLYCPQPAIDSESIGLDAGLSTERAARQKVSVSLQRLLLLFRAARCSLPAARWYIDKLLAAQKIINKIRVKAGLPPLCPFPDSLLRYCKARSGFFKPGAAGDGASDAISIGVIGSFRDLCGLCWMFHIREQLSENCRKYQAARDNTRSTQDCEVTAECDAAVVDHCLNSLCWACRMLPFARFMNAEELLQDIILSLVSELPPIRKVAEILVRAFPDVEDVRVPLRDKYHSLQQRLRHSTVHGPDGEEMMSVLLHELHRQKRRVLKRTVQSIGPTEQHIWERAEDSLRDQEDQAYDRFSLGTSLSRSSLTDTRRGQQQGDGDTTDNVSEECQDLSDWQDNILQLLDTGHRNTVPSLERSSASRDNGPDCRNTVPSLERSSASRDNGPDCRNTVPSLERSSASRDNGPDCRNTVPSLERSSASRDNGPDCRRVRKDGASQGHTVALPVVGSWEFERDDEEYVKFLELFLSYLLERDRIVNEEPAVPLLGSCSAHLKELELNSLVFQVHTTLKRRQSRSTAARQASRTKNSSHLMSELGCGGGSKPPASSPTPGLLQSTVHSEGLSQEHQIHRYFPAVGPGGRVRGRGLFGLKLHSLPSQLNVVQSRAAAPDPACSTKRTERTPSCSVFALLEEDLTPELELRFQSTAKLLEWMIRWSERRLLCGPHKVEKLLDHRTVIRVRTSMPAILRSLWLLDGDLKAETLENCNHRNSQRKWQSQQSRIKLDRESSVDTGYPRSLNTPIIDLEADIEGPFIQSDDAEDFQKQDLSHTNHSPPQELTSDSDSGTEEGESANGDGGHATCRWGDEGEQLINTCVYKEEEDPGPKPCTPFSPGISISIKAKPRNSSREKMDRSLDVETPHDNHVSKEPGQGINEPISNEPGELEEQMEGKETLRVQCQAAIDRTCSSQTTSQASVTAPERSDRLPSLADSSLHQPVSRQPTPAASVPAVSVPAVSVPAVPVPAVSVPAVSVPAVSVPAVSVPAVSVPAVSVPAVSVPAVSVPAVSVPAVSVPAVSVPAVSVPAVSVPAVPVPAVSVPAVSVPAVSVPAVSVPAVSVPAVSVPAVSVPAVSVPAVSVPAASQTLGPNGHTVNTCDLVGHLLQDEMFKLVQLQQINFMSLMQVVGSSLTNLPSIQQQIPPIRGLVTPTSNANINPTLTSQAADPGEKECERAGMESSPPVQRPCSLPQDKKVAQKPEEFSLHPPPEGDDVRTLPRISDFQSVPPTGSDSIRPHLLLNLGPQPPAALFHFTPRTNPTAGLPLLRLQPHYELRTPSVTFTKLAHSIPLLQPTPREAWVPSPESRHRPQPSFPSHLNSAAYDPGTLQKAAEEQERKEELLRRGPPKHLNLEQYQQPPASHWTEPPARGPLYSAERFPRQFPPPSSHAGCSQMLRMPLLHLPQPTLNTHFPLMEKQLPNSQTEPGRSWILSAASAPSPRQQQPYRSFNPETQVSVVNPPKLIPAQDLIAFEQGRRRSSRQPSGQQQPQAFHLLKVNVEPFEPRTNRGSKKRLKRRHERQRTERLVSKPPQSDQQPGTPDPPEPQEIESRVSMQEPADVPEVANTSDNFAPLLALCGSRLQGQIGLFATSAELHCFASTKKNAEERKDVGTNTEQLPEPLCDPASATQSDKDAGNLTLSEIRNNHPVAAAAVQTTPVSSLQVQVVPPDVFMNLRFPGEECQKPLLTPADHATLDQVVSAHKFLNVIDIDAGELLNSLPVTTVSELMPSSDREDISIAGLHHMAATVTNAVPPESCQQQESPALSQAQPRSEDWEHQRAGDYLTQRLLRQDSTNVWTLPQASPHSAGTKRVRAQLSEMEYQLSALQDMAVNMEQDFANTKMLINTIEHLHSAMDHQEPGERSTIQNLSTQHAGAALQSPVAEQRVEKRRYLQTETVAGFAVCADRHQTAPLTGDRSYLSLKAAALSPKFVDWHRRSPRLPAQEKAEDRLYSTARSPVSADWHRHTPSPTADGCRLSADHHRLSRESASSTDNRLHLSGMSGVSDIVAELFTEGKLSTKGLGLSEEQIQKLSRYSKPPKRSEHEQKEVREWMKQKRQQRLQTYQQHREDLRTRERAPYHPKQKKLTNKDIKENQKRNAVRKRVTLAENHEERTRAALSLMNEMLCDTVQLPTTRPHTLGEKPRKSVQLTQTRHSSTPAGRWTRSRSLSVSRAERRFPGTSPMRPTRSVSSSPDRSPQAGTLRQVTQRRPSPVTGSTYRGVIRQTETRAAYRQTSNRPSSRLGTQPPAGEESDAESDPLTLWNPPEQIRQILDREDDPFLQEADLAKADGGADCELSDIQSDSTSSVLSNLDWNAVNRMVATLEQP